MWGCVAKLVPARVELWIAKPQAAILQPMAAKAVHLELSDGKSHKFWEATPSGATLTVRFGRIGTAGQTQTKRFGDAVACESALAKLIAEKTRKGYAPTKGSAPTPTTKAPARGASGVAAVIAELEALIPAEKRKSATAAQLAAIEKTLGSVPDDLRALYGFAANLDRASGDIDGLEWLGVGDAVAIAKDIRKYGAPPAHLPIAGDGAGNYSCYDAASGAVFDWDHETRKSKRLAPDLAGYLGKQLLREVKRLAAETKALAADRGKPAPVANELAALPSKLVPVPNALLAKLDRPGYGGGVRAAQFIADDAIILGFDSSATIVKLGKTKERGMWGSGGDGAFDPVSGRVLLAHGNSLGLADAKAGKTTHRWKGGGGSGQRQVVRFAPDGSLACVGAYGGALDLWDTGKMKGIPKKYPGDHAMAWDVEEGTPLASLDGHDGCVTCAFSPDGALLASGCDKGKLYLWNVAKRSRAAAATFKADGILGVDFLRDGQAIAVGLRSGAVAIVDLRGKTLRRWATKEVVCDVRVVSSDAIATISHKTLRLWDLARGKELAKLVRKSSEREPRITDQRGDLLLTRGPLALVRMV